MHKTPEQIEAMLGRLVPTGLSRDAADAIGGMLDELAPSVSERPAGVSRWRWARLVPSLSAAALLCLGALFWDRTGDDRGGLAHSPSPSGDGFRLVAQSGRIDSMSDIGWSTDRSGSALRAVRLSVVEESELLDAETGMLMTLRQPREEILLTPVTSF